MKNKRISVLPNGRNLWVNNRIIWWLIKLLVLANELVIVSSQWTGVVLPDNSSNDSYPTVYKCCPLNQRYQNGRCIDSTLRMDRDDHWKPPKAMIHDNSTDLFDYPVVFRLLSAQPNCTSGVVEKIILNETVGDGALLGDGYELGASDVVLSSQGYLIWTDEKNFVNTYHVGNFCIDQINKTAYVAVMCKPTCSDDRPCIRKCCPPDTLVDDKQDTCVRVKNPWKPFIYDLNGNDSYELANNMDDIVPHYQVGVPACNYYYFNLRKENKTSSLRALRDGTLVTIQDNKLNKFSSDVFCIDGVVSSADSGLGLESLGYSGAELDQIAIICAPDSDTNDETPFMLYAVVEYISSFFLILTATVYLILWEYQNIHGWLQFSYVISLFFAYVSLASTQIFASFIHETSTKICETIGASIHFFFLSSFFWLTSMNFDLWWTFSGCRPLRASTRTGEKKRFAVFAFLSWGGAILIMGAAVTLDTVYGDDSLFSDYLPQFGKTRCYFQNDESKLPFFYAPVGLMLIVNIIFFLSTIYSLHKLQKDTRFATKQSSKQDKKRFLLFMKLFIVMGVCWIFEFISSLTVLFSPENKKIWSSLFLVTDMINGLQGFFIFLIFTCKPNTCKQLEGQFKKSSTRLEESRDKTVGSVNKSTLPRWFVVGFCTIALVAVRAFRKLFNYCGRSTRTLDGRRNPSHNTVTSSFEKSRKASDSSACTVFTVIDPGTIEMETTY